MQAGLIAVEQINCPVRNQWSMIEPLSPMCRYHCRPVGSQTGLATKEGVKIFFGTYGSALSSVMTGVINRNGGYYMEVIS